MEKKIENEEKREINTLESLPEMIDKDYGFFLMFGPPDENTTKQSVNYDAVVEMPKFR